MKILYVIPILPPSIGGCSVYFDNILSEMGKVQDIDEIFVITTKYKSPFFRKEYKCTIYRLLPANEYFAKNYFTKIFYILLSNFMLMVPLSYLIIKKRPNIVHTHSSPSILIITTIISAITKSKLIWDIRDMLNPKLFFKILIKIRSPDLVVVSSNETKKYIKDCGYSGDVLIVPPPLFSTKQNSKIKNIKKIERIIEFYEKNHSKTKFLFLGKLKAEKGICETLQAFKKLLNVRDDAILAIVGKGPLEGKVKSFIEENGLGDNVKYFGPIQHNYIPEILKRIDFLISPSKSEGKISKSGVAINSASLEALYFSKPIIGTILRKSDLDPTEEGIFGIRSVTANEIYAAINLLLEDEQLRKKLESNAKYQEHRPFEYYIKKLVEKYRLLHKINS